MYTAPKITSLVHSGQGSESLHRGADLTGNMSDEHLKLVEEMHKLQKDMEPHWQGDAAAAAYAGVNPLIQASKVAGEHLAKAKSLYEGQGSSFDNLKAKVGKGVGPKPEPQYGSPHNYGVEQTNTAEIDAWHEEAKHIVDSYNVYKGQSDHNAASWPEDYGKLGLPPGGADFTVATPSAGLGGGGTTPPPSFGGGYQATGGGSAYTTGAGAPASDSAPSAGGGGYAATPSAPGGYFGGGYTAAPNAPGGGSPQVPAASDTSTGTSSYTDTRAASGYGRGPAGGYGAGPAYGGYTTGQGGGYSGYGAGPGGSGQGSGQPYGYGYGGRSASGAGPTRGYGGSGYGGSTSGGYGARGSAAYGAGAGGFGRRGSSGFGPTGSGGGQGSPPGAGRSSGVGPATREAGGSARGVSAATGSSTSATSGRGFMPGMGGAGRGQGGDDTHERPTYLEENDIDSIFGPDPDDKTVPPVIGL